MFQQKIYECLKYGSIPVILKSKSNQLPFHSFIDWKQASITIPLARLPELHFILRSINLQDIMEMKRKGTLYYYHYFSTYNALSITILSFIRQKLLIPGKEERPKLLEEYKASEANSEFMPSPTRPAYDDEYLGPVENPYDSHSYSYNFTGMLIVSEKTRDLD